MNAQPATAADALFGSFDPERVKTYFTENALNMLSKIRVIIESKKSLFIFQSTADPYQVFLNFISKEGWEMNDLVIILGMVIVFGRSLKSLNKQSENETGKEFRRICLKYRLMYNYKRDKMQGDAKRFTTKVEHVFAAFPYVAKMVQTYLSSISLINLSTVFTTAGIDFQSSTALSIWKDAQDFGTLIYLHELKNQLYIAKRTQGVDYAALSTMVTYKGKQMSTAQQRIQQAIDSRAYTILGLTSPDLIVKLLWSVNINCPPFKAHPAYSFVSEAGNTTFNAVPYVVTINLTETFEESVKRCETIATQSGIVNQYQKLFTESRYKAEDWHPLGLSKDVLNIKVSLFHDICSGLGISAKTIKIALGKIGFTDTDIAAIKKQDPSPYTDVDTAYEALLAHLRA
jgi:hypothetical protein